ncbi:MAG: hypothetical protein IH899_03490, partial [Planctomycetes bacterium]|nr:hypothetical protein [Planctomycetota bacterium]
MTHFHKLTALFCAAGILAAMLLFVGSISSPSPSFAAKGGGGGGKPPKDDPPPPPP